MKKTLVLLFCTLYFGVLSQANDKLVISQWLTIPAHEVRFPVFYDEPNTAEKTFENRHLLEFDHISFGDYYPQTGKPLTRWQGIDLAWREAFTDSNGYVFIEPDSDGLKPLIAYAAVYIQAERWMETTLEIKSPHMLRAWLNGEQIGIKHSTEEDEGTVGRVSKDLKLERGKHLLLIKTLKPADAPLDWKIMANLEIKDPWQVSDLDISLSPQDRKNIYHIMDGLKITGMHLSHDGTYYLVNYSRSQPPSDQAERWSEIKRVSDQQVVHSFRHARISQLQWLPKSNRISYLSSRNGKTSLHLHDLTNGKIEVLMEDMEKFSGYRWAPDESFIIYSLREEGSSIDGDMRHFLGLQDRQPHFRHRSFLYHFAVESGIHQRLTFGNLTTHLHDISPDSRQIVFSQSYPDYSERPYSRQNMYLLQLDHLQLDTLWQDKSRSLNVTFSPDGKYLAATGGPSSFDGIGKTTPEGVFANNYDTQAFLFELQTRNITPITRDFDPSIASIHWHKTNNHLYFLTTDEDFRRLYKYDVRRERINLVDMGQDFVSSVSYASQAPVAVVSASQTNAPSKHYLLNLRNERMQLLEDTESHIYRHVEFGTTRQWDFTASSGVEIKGRVYYPPDFDPQAKYPVIVYYYGGMSPVSRSFGGRYPFNLWAGNGYLVYVLQPSGAIGFGQEFSAAHVNNWGITVADEIIEGTQKFLESHPYANAEKVGCAGASYGGFMTMLLMTRTDLFAAAISHSGISSISSYWGEGYWGYAYSSEATAENFPWNSPEIYVDQSALFRADRINTPLLLITGDSDTNVPPGESVQLFTALKLLNRPVEMVMVKGEDHHILTYGKRILWHKAIMAWWDRYLKDQPQWWDEQFPTKNYYGPER